MVYISLEWNNSIALSIHMFFGAVRALRMQSDLSLLDEPTLTVYVLKESRSWRQQDDRSSVTIVKARHVIH